MSIEENKAIVTQFMQMRGGRPITDVVAPDFFNHVNDKVGVEALQAIGSAIRETFPDVVVEIEDVIAEGDKVVVRRTLRGTHQGSALPLVGGDTGFRQTHRVPVHSHLPAPRRQDRRTLGAAQRS